MDYPLEILLFSEVFVSEDILFSAVNKLQLPIHITTTGSNMEVKSMMEKGNFSIIVTDTYITNATSAKWFKEMFLLHKDISFLLIAHDQKEENIFEWLDFGFSHIVSSSLELAVAIKKELSHIVQIKEHQDLEKKLRQSNQFLQLILDHVPAGIFWKDKDSNYLGCNQLHARAMHFTKSEDIIGKSDRDFHYSNAKLELFREDDLHVIRDNSQIARITSFDRNDNGEVIWTQTNKVPIQDEYGNVIGILGLYKDITKSVLLEKELQEREIHYRTIIEHLSEGVIVYDSDLNVINCNPSAERITGFSLHQLIDKEYKKAGAILVDEKGSIIKKNELPHFKTRNHGTFCSNVVIGFRYKDGNFQWIRFNTVPIFQEDAKLSLIVSTLVDITEQKKIEQELFVKKKMQAIGSITSTIVHDFNNILQPIMLLANILQRELSKLNPSENIEKLVQYSSDIRKATNNGKEMIHQILRNSKKVNEPSEIVDLIPAIQNTLNEIQVIKPDHIRIQFRTELKSAKIKASPIHIHQVIFNLCNNSIFAMKLKKEATLYLSLNQIVISEKVKTKLLSSDNPFGYELIIKDDGIGIKQENLDRIFEPYFTTKQNEGGTGLGLASVYTIIETLNGNISVISKEGVGTTFTIYFPMKEYLL